MKAHNRPKMLDQSALRALALHYVGRYATSTAKLRRYLERKVRERGWDPGAARGDDRTGAGVPGHDVPDYSAPDYDAIVANMVAQHYVDDGEFGAMRARALDARGYGAGRVRAELAAAGLSRELTAAIAGSVDADAAAESYARRRRFGRWDSHPPDADRGRRQFAAMLRAGHSTAAIRKVLHAADDAEDDAGFED